jgi:hypothetical protein
MGIAFRRLFDRWLGDREHLEAGGFILSATPLYWNIKQSLPSKDTIQYRRYALQYWASSLFTGVLMAGILAFEAHAYYVLHSAQFAHDILWLISLCFTLLCLVISAFNFIAWYLTARSQASSLT